MKSLVSWGLKASLAVIFCAGAAHAADVVFQQNPVGPSVMGPFANFNHNISTQRVADNFSLANPATVSEIAWWGWTYNNQLNAQGTTSNLVAFDIRIMASDGLAGAPSTVIHQETIPIASVEVTNYAAGPLAGQTYAFSAPLITAVPLAAGTQYWIAINAVVSNPNNNGDLFVWLESSVPASPFINEVAVDGLSDPLDDVWVPTDTDYNVTFRVLAVSDTDTDGLTDTDETTIWFTNPLDPDTDNDGLLDGTEADLFLNGSCVNVLVTDTDGDTLTDGAEVTGGTNPCDQDTDGDGIADPIDPNPLVANASNAQTAETLRGIGDVILSFPVSEFAGPNNNARKARRNALANRYYAAALLAQLGLDLPAALLIYTVDLQIDGDPTPPDWMLDSADRDLLQIFTDMAIDMLV